MSKTERALTSGEPDDALGNLFDDDFDEAFDEALDQAEFDLADLDVAELEADDEAVELEDVDLDVESGEAVAATVDEREVDDEATRPHESVDVDDLDVTDLDATDADIDVTDLDATDADIDVTDLDEIDAAAAHDAGDAVSDLDDDIDTELDTDAELERDEHAAPVPELADVEDATDEPVDDQLPEIVEATPFVAAAGVAAGGAVARDHVGDPVSDEILEELRRADIDGPVVEMAPQDDTTAARRRPRRSADYDPAPVPIPADVPRVLGRKPRVRKVTRVVRHVDPWSVFKIALVANLVLYVTVLTAGVLLWNVAHATGTVDNVERFFESFGWNSFEFNGGEIYHAGWIAGLFVVIGLTGLAVLIATLFNLITDLVGGIRFTVLEEEVVETRTSPMRRFVVRRPEPEVPALIDDGSGPLIREAVVDDTGANERPSR